MLKAFKAYFETLMKLHDYLKVNYKLEIAVKEQTLLFFNAKHRNMLVQQQKEYQKISFSRSAMPQTSPLTKNTYVRMLKNLRLRRQT